jgi:hypothetical protein
MPSVPESNYDKQCDRDSDYDSTTTGKQGVGPLKNQPQLTAEPID